MKDYINVMLRMGLDEVWQQKPKSRSHVSNVTNPGILATEPKPRQKYVNSEKPHPSFDKSLY